MADFSHLTPEHRTLLEASAISPEVAAERDYRSLDAEEAASELPALGFADWQARLGPGLYLPKWGVDGSNGTGQFRPDTPYVMKNGRTMKYLSPQDSYNMLDVHPSMQAHLVNPQVTIIFTEGIRTADSITSQGFVTVELDGVYGWRGRTRDGRTTTTLGDFESIPMRWRDANGTDLGRDVILMFDSDARYNSNVRLALERFGEFLRSRGAKVRVVLPPDGPNGEKQGVDDYLGTGGDFRALFTLPDNQPGTDGKLFDSWEAIDLSLLGDRDPTLPDLAPSFPIFYPRKRHVFSGFPESLKTLLLYLGLLLALRNGKRVGVLNFEMDEFDARDMFRDLGATEEELAQIVFRSPERAPKKEDIGRLVDERLDVIGIDAGAGMYDLEGKDDNRRIEVEEVARKWIKPLWRVGIATAMLDHLAKKGAGSWAIGAERKVGQTDVHLRFESKVMLVRGGKGVVKIKPEKDRPGYLRREYPHGFEVHIYSDPITNALTWKLRSVEEDEADDFRPTALMERVSKKVERQPGLSKTKLASGLGKKEWVYKAIDLLDDEGFIRHDEKGQGHYYFPVKPFREDDDIFGADGADDGAEGGDVVQFPKTYKSDDTCPMCGASGDEHCRTKNGKDLKKPHASRPHS